MFNEGFIDHSERRRRSTICFIYIIFLFVHIYICRERIMSTSKWQQNIIFLCALQFSRLTVNITFIVHSTWYRKNSIDFELSRSSSNFPFSNHIARYALELKFLPFILHIFTYGWIRITIIEVKDTERKKCHFIYGLCKLHSSSSDSIESIQS